jgi:superoxide reductase
MEEKHYIEWIEVRTKNNVYIKGLLPGEKPEAGFCVSDANLKARAYCNVHGLLTNPRDRGLLLFSLPFLTGPAVGKN